MAKTRRAICGFSLSVTHRGYSLHMSWFTEFKAKRAAKAATKSLKRAHATWQEDFQTLEKLIAVITAASKGEDSVPNTLMQAKGEHTLWSGTAVFHETGRTASRYQGGSSGVSVPVVAGIRFRVGAMSGQVIPGIEMQMDKDQGVVMLTNERLIFTGPLKTQQWDFDKVLMLSTSPDQSDYFISVSNRDKTSGVRFDPVTGREFNRFLGSATAVHESGYEEVLKELNAMRSAALASKPALELPTI
jgi:hypothetical protein